MGVRGASVSARLVSVLATIMTGAEIDWQAQIGPGLFLSHPVGVVIGPGVKIGSDVFVGAGVLLGSTYGESRRHPTSGFPTIADRARILAKASVIGPVTVGVDAAVGAHALVLSDVPPGTIARGVPARCYLSGRELPFTGENSGRQP